MEMMDQSEREVEDRVELWTEGERRRLARLCGLLVGDPSAADDLAQETLLQAWRIRHRLEDASGASAWLDAVARNVCLRWRVRQARLRAHEVTTALEDDRADAHAYEDDLTDALEREELAELLERALGLLPPDTRQALVWRYVDELGPRQIADRLSVTPQTVTMRLLRGRARLREVLESDLAEDPLARAWVDRHGVAWRPTRLRCAVCGSATTHIRRDERAGVVQTRCTSCDPTGVAAAWSLDNPALGPLLNQVRRPSAVVGRMAVWAHAWWPTAIEAGRAPCTRCGAQSTIAPYRRPEQLDPHSGRGWHATCASCGEELTTSLLGFVLNDPGVRRLRERHPRLHAVPTREIRHQDRPALAVGLADEAAGVTIEMLFDAVTTHPLGVVTTG